MVSPLQAVEKHVFQENTQNNLIKRQQKSNYRDAMRLKPL